MPQIWNWRVKIIYNKRMQSDSQSATPPACGWCETLGGGKEAVQEILNIDPNAKVVVSSGYSNDPIMANFMDYCFSSAIVKPYRLQELSRVLSEIIDWCYHCSAWAIIS